jgi:hypothetical protein
MSATRNDDQRHSSARNHTDLIGEAYARYQAAERAYYGDALYPLFGIGLELLPEWREEVEVLRDTLLQARDSYFEVLTTY